MSFDSEVSAKCEDAYHFLLIYETIVGELIPLLPE